MITKDGTYQIITDVDGDQFWIFAIPDIETLTGPYPKNCNFIVYEQGTCPIMDGLVLYGFDEVESLPKAAGFKKPAYCFASVEPVEGADT